MIEVKIIEIVILVLVSTIFGMMLSLLVSELGKRRFWTYEQMLNIGICIS